MYKCYFCGLESDDIDDFEPDYKYNKGFWCPDCDSFTFYNKDERSFILLLEDKKKKEKHLKAPFNVHVSPLRYPGGKSLLAGKILNSCRKENMYNFIEPFCGGASVGLSLLLSGNIKELYLNDIDYGIYSLFYMIKYEPEPLKNHIQNFTPSKEEYEKCKSNVLNKYNNCSKEDAAWSVLVTNRLSFSGIAFANCMSNPSSRWNPKTLCKRIDEISRYKEHIHISNMDALECIEEMYSMQNATLYIDPPYFEKGQKLYPCAYTKGDHLRLAFLLDSLHSSMPGADILITYDLQEEIINMYDYPMKDIIGRNYSISNKKGA